MTVTTHASLYLASASPRRAFLLEQIGVSYARLTVDVDETPQCGEDAPALVLRLALAKARSGLAKAPRSDLPVLGADTEVVIDGAILGKPRDREHGLAMLKNLSGRKHTVMSAVALVKNDHEAARLCLSTVTLRTLTESECISYWDSGEPRDKAGGYALQGLGAAFITHIEGSYSGIVGLPLYETAELLREFAVDAR